METGFQRIDAAIQESLIQINATKSSKPGYLPGLSTGLDDLDKVLGGFQPGCFYAIGGCPGMGKTGLALTILRNVAVNTNETVGMFSLDLNNLQVATRLLCMEAQMDSHLVRTGKLSRLQYEKLIKVSNKLKSTHIWIDDTPLISRSTLRAKARRLKAERDIKLLVIDYLQLIKEIECSDDSECEERKTCQMLKSLANELAVPVVLLIQLTSKIEKREDKRPKLYDFRYPDVISKTADGILFIYRPWVYFNDKYSPADVDIIIAKNYNSPTGVVRLKFIDSYAEFESISG